MASLRKVENDPEEIAEISNVPGKKICAFCDSGSALTRCFQIALAVNTLVFCATLASAEYVLL